ncbi:unnamed protein product [Acanthoscelides obtectus]|uniref:DDE Tnp4 domain-containing protein n=1 Tax=Acanthoscelides obtectus TaxID=200917 RepID=A0A9P0P3F2_ACAOB|nr:unnamed protein product [Acanthoscelides obtectus]CAK1668893.1 Protein ALP1-like [Acanthoscelides obtectus]
MKASAVLSSDVERGWLFSFRALSKMKREKKIALVYRLRKYKKALATRLWIHPLVAERSAVGAFYTLFTRLREHEAKFFNYFRTSVATFDYLLQRLDKHIARQETNMRQAIQPTEMLALTIRYLASGMTFTDLHYAYRLGTSTIRKIVRDVCRKFWEILLDECIPPPSEKVWNECEAGFANSANFPNCFGAIDGKHIRIVKPQRSGSLFYNYKHFFSIVLLAVVDTSYRFRYVDIAAYGKECDSSVFKESTFFHALNSDSLYTPCPKCLPGTENPAVPYILVGDEAFGLSDKLLRPFG